MRWNIMLYSVQCGIYSMIIFVLFDFSRKGVAKVNIHIIDTALRHFWTKFVMYF